MRPCALDNGLQRYAPALSNPASLAYQPKPSMACAFATRSQLTLLRLQVRSSPSLATAFIGKRQLKDGANHYALKIRAHVDEIPTIPNPHGMSVLYLSVGRAKGIILQSLIKILSVYFSLLPGFHVIIGGIISIILQSLINKFSAYFSFLPRLHVLYNVLH